MQNVSRTLTLVYSYLALGQGGRRLVSDGEREYH
jgi:hypothetical protein